MAFNVKEWKNRLVEYAGRRKLTNVATGEEMVVDVARAEGTVSQAGNAFSAAEMNDLEARINAGFEDVLAKLAGCEIKFEDADGNPTDVPYLHYWVEVPDEETKEAATEVG